MAPSAMLSGDWDGEAGGAAIHALLAQDGAMVTGAISWTRAGTGQCVLAVTGSAAGAAFRLTGQRKDDGASAPQLCPDGSVFEGEAGDQALVVARSPWGAFVLRPADALRALAERCRWLLEARRFAELAELLPIDQVWAFDRPLPLAAARARVEEVLGGAEDIHLWVERIVAAEAASPEGPVGPAETRPADAVGKGPGGAGTLGTDTAGTGGAGPDAPSAAGHLTLQCCLMWGEPQGFADHELELDLHLGFRRGPQGAWAIGYLGVTAPGGAAGREERAAAAGRPGRREPAAGAAPQERAAAGLASRGMAGGGTPPGGTPLDGTPPEGTPPAGLVLAAAAGEVPAGFARAYLPVLVPVDALRAAAAAPAGGEPPPGATGTAPGRRTE